MKLKTKTTINQKTKTVGAGPVSAQNGITIVSLVVTIIIMLILAGVTLNLTLGERGIFNTAKSTKDKQKIAEYQEKVEIARAGTAINNTGEVTIDKLIQQIYEDKIVPEGSISKKNENEAIMTTLEGYVFRITEDTIEYIDKIEAIPVPPDLTEANVDINIDPEEEWTNENVKISIKQKVGEKFILEYSTDTKEWKEYTQEIETNKNITIYARVKNQIGVVGDYTIIKIIKIDKQAPIKITTKISATTNTITIDASDASDAEATNEYGCSGIKQIWYSKDEGITWQTNEKSEETTGQTSERAEEKTYTYTELEQNKTYKIQVKIIDNAGNQTITTTQEITTGQVDIAEGNITISKPTWDASTHTATVAITKGSSVPSGLQIQYQINSTSGTWTTGTSKSGLKLNDIVYARLWDGTNGGAFTNLKITDTTPPAIPDITNPTNGNWTNEDFSITWASSDVGCGIAYYQYSYDQVTWNTSPNSNSDVYVTSPFSQERNQLCYVRCVDYAGNVSGVASTYVRLDKTPPATPDITNPTNGNWTNEEFSLTLRSNDACSGIAYYQYSYDQETWYTSPNSNSDVYVTSPFSQVRNQLVYIRCYDYAGNVSGVSSTWIRIGTGT